LLDLADKKKRNKTNTTLFMDIHKRRFFPLIKASPFPSSSVFLIYIFYLFILRLEFSRKPSYKEDKKYDFGCLWCGILSFADWHGLCLVRSYWVHQIPSEPNWGDVPFFLLFSRTTMNQWWHPAKDLSITQYSFNILLDIEVLNIYIYIYSLLPPRIYCRLSAYRTWAVDPQIWGSNNL